MPYVTRDSTTDPYCLWKQRPRWNCAHGMWVKTDQLIDEYCRQTFEKYTDIKLKGGPDSIIKIKKFKAVI